MNDVTMLDILKARAAGDWQTLNEASLHRIYQHVGNAKETSFAIITSWRKNPAKRGRLAAQWNDQNAKDFKQLKTAARNLGTGYFKLRGLWRECEDDSIPYEKCPEAQRVETEEPALFIIGISQKDAVRLLERYKQDAIVYAGPDTAGRVVLIFRGGVVQDIGKFNPNKIAQAYSRVRGKAFAFEYVAQGWSEVLAETTFRKNKG